MILSVYTGFALGMGHVLSGPDHLAAVAPLSMTRQGRSWMIGVRWGMGHASGVILVAVLAYILREVFAIHNISWLSSWSERLVGVVLVAIGIWGIRRTLTHRVHTHAHTHDGQSHLHIHVHPARTAHPVEKAKPHFHTHTAFAVGILHGLAGYPHLMAVLPVLMLPPEEAVAYLLAFGLGTVLSMGGFSYFMDFIARKSAHRSAQVYRFVATGFSAAAIVIGCFWFFKPAQTAESIPQKTAHHWEQSAQSTLRT